MTQVEIWVADVPPSLNEVGARGIPRQFQRVKKSWQSTIETLLMAEGFTKGNERVQVKATLRFPMKRGRDTGNFAALLEKATGDALVNGLWLKDDTADRFSFTLAFDPELGPRRTTLVIEGVESLCA